MTARSSSPAAAAEAMKQKVSDTVVKDLAGKLLMPGFIDPHSHFMDSLTMADRVNVSAPPGRPGQQPGRDRRRTAEGRQPPRA